MNFKESIDFVLLFVFSEENISVPECTPNLPQEDYCGKVFHRKLRLYLPCSLNICCKNMSGKKVFLKSKEDLRASLTLLLLYFQIMNYSASVFHVLVH